MNVTLLHGDVFEMLCTLPEESVQCCVTSPPYWGLRDYGVDGQLGLERTYPEYIAKMVLIFREVWRVLRSNGTLWLNLGDSYAMSTKGSSGKGDKQLSNAGTLLADRTWSIPRGLKRKDLVGIPWRVALALQEDGWYLRSDIIWHKPNPMPESVTDRPTKAHEYLFLLSKCETYFYDKEAIAEPVTGNSHPRGDGVNPKAKLPARNSRVNTTRSAHGRPPQARQNESFSAAVCGLVEYRNKRSVWEVGTQPNAEAHFATYPEKLVEPCIMAGSRSGDTVLDPFVGSGTTGVVARRLGRAFLGIDLNNDYLEMARRRIGKVTPPLPFEVPDNTPHPLPGVGVRP